MELLYFSTSSLSWSCSSLRTEKHNGWWIANLQPHYQRAEIVMWENMQISNWIIVPYVSIFSSAKWRHWWNPPEISSRFRCRFTVQWMEVFSSFLSECIALFWSYLLNEVPNFLINSFQFEGNELQVYDSSENHLLNLGKVSKRHSAFLEGEVSGVVAICKSYYQASVLRKARVLFLF